MEVQALGDVEGPVVIDLHVSAVSSEVFSIKEYPLVAEVGLSSFAVLAGSIGVSNRADSDFISNFEVGDMLSDESDLSDNFVTWTAGVIARAYKIDNSKEYPIVLGWS